MNDQDYDQDLGRLATILAMDSSSDLMERHRFFEISRGSIAEVSACMDAAAAFGLISQIEVDALKPQLRHCYGIIRKLP